jgi:hypothetical protein
MNLRERERERGGGAERKLQKGEIFIMKCNNLHSTDYTK